MFTISGGLIWVGGERIESQLTKSALYAFRNQLVG